MRLEGKSGIVTGAAKGMGGAITRALAREGADLVLAARDLEALDQLAEELRAGGHRVETVATDVTDESAVKAMVERTLEVYGGRIDILVN
ncbi:MAG: SDR family NAD(P)-dependent oxidoreductase, partial [Alphaproteobacteria bacterium]|nr:SDR family NAD(P)-dependent oxidoreductase [Alphaproteobacteria bacterium]